MELQLENLPPSLREHADVIRECLIAFNKVMPFRAVYLFGSHARGDARPDSDVDLCLVSDGAGEQLDAAARFRRATRAIRPKPSFTLVPITPARLKEKQERGDHFQTVLREGRRLGDRDPQLADRFQPLCEELAERYFTSSCHTQAFPLEQALMLRPAEAAR